MKSIEATAKLYNDRGVWKLKKTMTERDDDILVGHKGEIMPVLEEKKHDINKAT